MTIIDEDPVKIVESDNSVLLTINRPKVLNALNADVLQSMILALHKLQGRSSLRAVVITGAGEKAFVAGADIQSLADLGQRAISDYIELGQRVMRAIECFPVPVIASVNGYALGGGFELALACDLIIASKTAKFGTPEVSLGIIPGFGGTQRLIQRAGIGVARRLVYTGEIFEAEEALKLGLVEKLSEPAALQETTDAVVAAISAKGPLAIREAKRVIRQSQEDILLSGLRLEVESFLDLFSTPDREEGMRAFLEKRQPSFSGRRAQ